MSGFVAGTQREITVPVATRCDANDLILRGALALSRVEAAGIKIDTEYLARTTAEISAQVKTLTAELRNDPIFARWRKRYGEKTKIGSREQLATILFDDMKYPAAGHTRGGRNRADEEALATVDLQFVRDWLKCEKLKKLNATYLKGVANEVYDGYLHPSFNLHLVTTYRSSCDSPNFQNIPIRDPEMGGYIRRAFIPRKNRTLVEIDFKGAEVCVGACYHRDPAMSDYINDPEKDMHRDQAALIWKMRKSEIPKDMRYQAKSNFVFAEFYGSWYKNCAPHLWKESKPEWLEHLKRKTGISELGECRLPVNGEFFDPEPGTFECHLAAIEKDFWGRRFRGYADWKRQWYADYQKRGYFDMLTGFRCSGVFSKNEAVNYPIQGAAFHCLLWALIELNAWLRDNKMRSLIVGQIHDSMILDCTADELADVLAYAMRLITKELPRAWDWICIPLTVEIEGSEKNWFEKKPLAI
jgi:DNA polymerase-1